MKSFFKKIVVKILTLEAKFMLKKHKPFIIAITGSVGKTSTKDAIYTILKKYRKTRKSEKSFNSNLGVPLTILGLPNAWNNPFLWLKNIIDGFFLVLFSKDYPEILILETGIDKKGDMDELVSLFTPDLVVVTRLPDVPVHVENFKNPEEVVAEKMKLVLALKPEGKIIYNHDDQKIRSELTKVENEKVGFGYYTDAHFTSRKYSIFYHDDIPAGFSFFVDNIGDKYEVKIQGVLGMQNIYTYSAAIATAVSCGIPLESSVQSLFDHISPPGRMRIISGIKGTTLIDDTYNASPEATKQALETLREIKYAKRKIAVLGDMLELGKFSSKEHEKIGELSILCADVLFTVGVRAKQIAETALINNFDERKIFHFDDSVTAGKELQVFIQAGDVILIKASQGIRAEKIVEEIMEHPEEAKTLLVRQDEEWSKLSV